MDLAGSERAGTSASLTETSAINKSLSTLSKVIDELSKRDRQGKSHISYRDSVLTWLLKESLGGNSRTAMLATISPAVEHMSETLSTLRYASQARNIRNSVAANEDPSQVLIKKLRAEIDQLKADQKENSVGFSPYPAETQRELDELNRQLQTIVEEKDREMKELRAKIEAASEEKLAELKKKFRLYEYDIGTSDFPVLVLLSPDPMSIDAVSWQLTSKKIQVGTAENCDIRLSGVLDFSF